MILRLDNRWRSIFAPFFKNPVVSRRFRQWYEHSAAEQCGHFDESMGFSYPTVPFNLVYLMYHLFQHYLYEGVGLRQVTDYCCVLMHSDEVARRQAFEVVKHLGMARFCGRLMWVMAEVYGVERGQLLCEPDAGEGRLMLDEFMRGAAFGRFDERNGRSRTGDSVGGGGSESVGQGVLAAGVSGGGESAGVLAAGVSGGSGVAGVFDGSGEPVGRGILSGEVGATGRRTGGPVGQGMLAAGVSHLRRDFRFLTRYPAEVLCAPFWKFWHWAWRVRRGYLG